MKKTPRQSAAAPAVADSFADHLRAQAYLDSRTRRGDGRRRPGRPCRSAAAGDRPCPCRSLSRAAVAALVADASLNQRTWRALCLAHIAQLLAVDGYALTRLDPREAEPGRCGLPVPRRGGRRVPRSAVAVFADPTGQRQWHVYFDDQDPDRLRRAAAGIARADGSRFHSLALLVFPNRRALEPWRRTDRAEDWPRGFMTSFEDLRNPDLPRPAPRIPLLCPALEQVPVAPALGAIARVAATVEQNIPVGGKNSPYFKLRIRAPQLADLVPGQFIMLDTRPRSAAGPAPARTWSDFKTAFAAMPATYLKRPFGIHRAFYPGFDPRVGMGRLAMPRAMALRVSAVQPAAFDIFCKIPPRGKGTREMRDLKPGARLGLLGPLGRRFDLDPLVAADLDEVHVIGGGVGMAPLVYLVQALRFRNVPVKAFIGFESIESLRYRTDRRRRAGLEHDPDFSADSRHAHMYIDDLKEVGIAPDRIYLASDRPGRADHLVPPGHYRAGLIGPLYADVLRREGSGRRILAFTCGPTPMMKAVHAIARKNGVRLFVFMEKRMACGIGVCLSCVCKTRNGYARVCRDGPVFAADEMDWS